MGHGEEPGTSGEGATREGARHAEETLEQALHAREGVGKREGLLQDLTMAGRSKVRCGEGRCLEQIGTSGREDRTRREDFLRNS